MATFNRFNQFSEDLAKKVHNLGSDTLKVLLSNVAPVATNAVKADITEIGTGNGYTAGGSQATISSCTQTAGVTKLVLADVVFYASGAVGPFRYVVLYNDTPSSPLDPLIGWYDYGSSITLLDQETFTVDFDPSSGAVTIG